MAAVYSDRGYGVRAPVVFYNRSNEAAARLAPGDFDWPTIFGRGVGWFHSGGIFASLSPTTAELIVEAMRAARAAGAVVSFDLELPREALDGLRRRGARRGDALADRRAGGRARRQRGGPAARPWHRRAGGAAGVGARSARLSRHDRARRGAVPPREGRRDNASGGALGQPPQLECGRLGGRRDATSRPRPISTCSDRVGGGDGFASGFFYGLLTGESPEDALRLGWAHGALLATFPGDTTMATADQVRAVAMGTSARIQR